MRNTQFITRTFAAASLAFAFAATPVAFSVQQGLQNLTATAKEAESGGKHKEAGDDRGGKHNEAGDDRGGNKGGKRGGDDHPGSHSQNGKRK